MTQPAAVAIAAFLIVVSVVLVWSHVHRRRRQPAEGLDAEERRYRERQFRRRMLTSVMIGLLGMAMLAGHFLVTRQSPLVFLAFWCGVLLTTLWILLSALVDALTTSRYAAVRRKERMAELGRIEGDLRRAVGRRRNGEAPKSS